MNIASTSFTRTTKQIAFGVALAVQLATVACSSAAQPVTEAAPKGSRLAIGQVLMRGVEDRQLHPLGDRSGYTNGTDTFYTTRLADGGTFVLYRYAPTVSTIMSNPYPEITLPGRTFQYVEAIPTQPFYKTQVAPPQTSFAHPYKELKWPALRTDAGVGIFFVAESPIFEEAIEPFVSAFPSLQVAPGFGGDMRLSFAQHFVNPQQISLNWLAVEHTQTTTTYLATVTDTAARAVAIHLSQPEAAQRIWYREGNVWTNSAVKQFGGPNSPDLAILDVNKANALLVESSNGPPTPEGTVYSTPVGYVQRARWAAFTVYPQQTASSFWHTRMTSSMKALNDRLYSLRDTWPVRHYTTSWRDLLELVGFTNGKNILNSKFFDRGLPVAGDPSFQIDPKLNVSVSWVGDEAALQAVMGQRLFGFEIDARYAQSVIAFYDRSTSFYYGMLNRVTGTFTSADTGSSGIVIGYNYLLALMRLTELVGSSPGLPSLDVQKLVDRVLPVLQKGYFDDYPQVAYLWAYPNLSTAVQSEYGMGRELSEAQLSYICGLWWLQTHEKRYIDCELQALRLPMEAALTLRGSSYLWGLDVVHGAYVTDALLLAYRTTRDARYLDAAKGGWREELLFLFSKQDYPETPFDDRAMAVTSYYSTFADLRQGNYWRGDAWNNSRVLWSLAKLLTYVDDPRIEWQLEMARETHKQSMPVVDIAYSPARSGFYDAPIDPNDFELNYEDLRNRYSTQVSYSNDVWREAFIYDSVTSSDARVYRIPGALLSDAGLAYIVGKPGATVHLAIAALDITFGDGSNAASVRLGASGTARVRLRGRTGR